MLVDDGAGPVEAVEGAAGAGGGAAAAWGSGVGVGAGVGPTSAGVSAGLADEVGPVDGVDRTGGEAMRIAAHF